tara:strand:- start:792 stop:1289 length:498 start_codon:yes stop_codon:yes gene_type:complete
MDISILDDATLWVAVSFLVFVILVFKPLANQISSNLEKKTYELKKSLDEAKKLKDEANLLYEQHLSKQKESLKKIEIMNKKILEESNKIKIKIEEELNLNLNRKQKNFKQISSQMELKIKEEIKREILRQTILFTEHRIKKNISKKHNDKFVEDSLNKLTGHLHQ